MNQVHHQTLAATKASRVVNAAGKDRAVVDFGLRRMHGADAGVKSARSFHIAGAKATSNVYGGFVYGVPISGTMAHSYVQAHDEELDAFRSFTDLYPDTILLVDTYDTLEGVKLVIKLAEELGDDFRVSGIRLDSGDLEQLAFASRKMLDDAGLNGVSIFASSSLDEYKIYRMVKNGAPIDGFGVGTHMGVSDDEPYLDMVYKLVLFAGEGRLKTSPGKGTLPGRKQVFRQEDGGKAVGDVIAGADESHGGRKLLRKVMDKGQRLPDAAEDIEQARETAERELGMLPENILALEKADPPYEVRGSGELKRRKEAAVRRVT
jgi:nicotinate phosphoribosyltransferase